MEFRTLIAVIAFLFANVSFAADCTDLSGKFKATAVNKLSLVEVNLVQQQGCKSIHADLKYSNGTESFDLGLNSGLKKVQDGTNITYTCGIITPHGHVMVESHISESSQNMKTWEWSLEDSNYLVLVENYSEHDERVSTATIRFARTK